MQLVFLDTETTGNDVTKDRLCQICYKFEDKKNEDGVVLKKGEIVTKNFKPPVPISIKAMSVTNITNKMVENEEPFQGSETAKNLQAILRENILVAHNAKFDIAMLNAEGVEVPRSICTLRLARYLDSDCEIQEYSLQFLRYYYEVELDVVPHSAEGDVLVLEAVFNHLYKKAEEKANFDKGESFEKRREIIIKRMLEISSQPSLIKKFVFGKHNGEMVADVARTDRPYLEWLFKTKQEEGDEDWVYTLRHFLGR